MAGSKDNINKSTMTEKEINIIKIAEESGWSKRKTQKEVSNARERLGISSGNYLKHKFWLIPLKKQKDAYRELINDGQIEIEGRSQNYVRALFSGIDKMNWSYKEAREDLKNVKKEYGLNNKEYYTNDFCTVPEEARQEFAEKIIGNREPKTIAVPAGTERVKSGEYLSIGKCIRIMLPEDIIEIEDGAFDSNYSNFFWCVEDTYASHRIARICPYSKLRLFDSEKAMLNAWQNKEVRQSWEDINKAVKMKDVYTLTYKAGWTYHEARAGAEHAYLEYGIDSKEFVSGDWMQWFEDGTNDDDNNTWIGLRKKQLDLLDKSIDSGRIEYNLKQERITPRRITAKKYTAEEILGEEIRRKKISVRTLCSYLAAELPEEFEELGDASFSKIAYKRNSMSKGKVFFCWFGKNVVPKAAKRAQVLCVFGPRRYKEAFDREDVPYIICDQIKYKMLELAELWGRQFPEVKTICITGSVGKTTSTEMINHVMCSSRKTLCVWSNLNTPISTCEIVQGLETGMDVYVQEGAGTRVGQLETTTRIVEPDIFVITNVGDSHIGRHGGLKTSLLYEKLSPDRRASKNALGVVNYDDPLLKKVPFIHDVVWFSVHDPNADYYAENIVEEDGIISFDVVEKKGVRTPVCIHAFGAVNIYNVLSAFAVGVYLGIDRSVIAASLVTYRSRGIRQNLLDIAGRRVFLDCFNASEQSIQEAIETLGKLKVGNSGKRVAVLGDVLELGNLSSKIHRSIGRYIKGISNVDEVIFFGPLMANAAEEAEGGSAAIRYTNSRNELIKWISETSRDDVVLLKSSHGMNLHRVADDWLGTTFYAGEAYGASIATDDLSYENVDGMRYTCIKKYGACIMKGPEEEETVIIPSKVGDYPVRLIYNNAFGKGTMKKIVCEPSMISIGDEAFYGCTQLETVSFPKTLYYIGSRAFQNCVSLAEIIIPTGCTTIAEDAFAGCSTLRKVSLPASIITIGDGAFPSDCNATFECVRGTYSARVIRDMCPNAKIVFVEEDELKKASRLIANNQLNAGLKNREGVVEAGNADENYETVTITAVGDCTLGRNQFIPYEKSWGKYFEEKGADYFLNEVAPVFKNSDLAIANLEGILSDREHRQVQVFNQRGEMIIANKRFGHIGKPEYIEALIAGNINTVSFANNHNIDYGSEGFIDTVRACNDRGLPIAYYDKVVRHKVGTVTVGIVSVDFTCCSDSIGEGYLKKGIADLRQDCALVVACVHWGRNYDDTANALQIRTGHRCVDLGADIVIGCHPHVIQGIEKYKGRYICYSLGNFCYGGIAKPRDNDAIIIQKTFKFKKGLLQIDNDLKVIPCRISNADDHNDYHPVIVEDTEKKTAIDKLNERSEKFELKFDYNGQLVSSQTTDEDMYVAPNQKYDEKIPSIIYTLTMESISET